MSLTIKTATDLQAEALTRTQTSITRTIDRHIETRAKAMGYNSAGHLASYVASSVPEWVAEAQAFVAWRDQVWQAAIHMLGQTDSADPPSVEGALANLPDWPD